MGDPLFDVRDPLELVQARLLPGGVVAAVFDLENDDG